MRWDKNLLKKARENLNLSEKDFFDWREPSDDDTFSHYGNIYAVLEPDKNSSRVSEYFRVVAEDIGYNYGYFLNGDGELLDGENFEVVEDWLEETMAKLELLWKENKEEIKTCLD